jgi:hypothetical protein
MPMNAARLYTSCFARLKRIPPELVPVDIAARPPRWAGRIRHHRALAPQPHLFGLALEAFVAGYARQLASLDPARVVAELGDQAVLLCFEAPGRLCHRRIVAEWLEEALGVVIPELGFPRELLPSWPDLPFKDQAANLPWEAVCDHCQTPNDVDLTTTRTRCRRCRRTFPVTL